jgi:Cu+-exporting ATPase
VVTDKTGTLTVGKPKLQQIILQSQKQSQNQVLELAAGLEAGSTHPLSHAIMAEVQAKKLTNLDFKSVKHQVGVGVIGNYKNTEYWIGGEVMLEQQKANQANKLDIKPGEMTLYLGAGKQLLASFVLADELKPTAVAAVAQLKKLGLKLSLLSGDRQKTAQLMADLVGIEKVVAQVSPEAKLTFIKELGQ